MATRSLSSIDEITAAEQGAIAETSMDQQGKSEETDQYLEEKDHLEEVTDHSEGSGEQEEDDEEDNDTGKFHILEPRENSSFRGKQKPPPPKPRLMGRRPPQPPPSTPNHNNVTENRPTEVAPKLLYSGNRHIMTLNEGDSQHDKEMEEKMLMVNMKRFILCGLGVPGIPEVSKCTQTICSVIAIIFYLILSIWGVVLCTISIDQSVGGPYRTIFILSALVGLFFILLGLFWALVFWWSKISKKASSIISFSLLVTLWFVLCFFSVAITSALFTVIVLWHEGDSILKNYQFFSVLGLGSVFILWTVHVVVFLCNVRYKRKSHSQSSV